MISAVYETFCDFFGPDGKQSSISAFVIGNPRLNQLPAPCHSVTLPGSLQAVQQRTIQNVQQKVDLHVAGKLRHTPQAGFPAAQSEPGMDAVVEPVVIAPGNEDQLRSLPRRFVDQLRQGGGRCRNRK